MACSRLFEVQFWVHLGIDNPIIFWPSSLKKYPITRIHLQSLAGIHYNVVVESEKFSNTKLENFDQTVQDNLWRLKETTSHESSQLKTLETVVDQEIQSLFTSVEKKEKNKSWIFTVIDIRNSCQSRNSVSFLQLWRKKETISHESSQL